MYSLPFAVTKKVKLSVLHFKVKYNILSTNSFLYKMKKKEIDSPICPFCPDTVQSISHLLVQCSLAVSFWNEFTEWYWSLYKKRSVTALSEYEILYGVLKGSSLLQTLNHLILIGKYFLFICPKKQQKISICGFRRFRSFTCEKQIELEKYIAIRENKLPHFKKKV